MILIYYSASARYKKDVLWVAEETPRWEHAAIRWNGTYYCYRDDVVFIPGDKNKYAPLNKARAYFYEQ